MYLINKSESNTPMQTTSQLVINLTSDSHQIRHLLDEDLSDCYVRKADIPTQDLDWAAQQDAHIKADFWTRWVYQAV